MLRTEDDANELWVLFDWDKQDFQRFVADPEAKEVMQLAGLQGPPEPIYVTSVGEVEA